jgi:hypothetical protein
MQIPIDRTLRRHPGTPEGHTLAVSDGASIHLFDKATFQRRRAVGAMRLRHPHLL